MIFKLEEEHITVKEAAREFALTRLKEGVIERDTSMSYPTEFVKEMGEMGFLSMMTDSAYGGSGMDATFVQMAILRRNKNAFVRSNPNYLYAGKTLHLPSLNDIRAMITGGGNTHGSDTSSGSDGYVRNEIFFFGG